MPLLKEIVPEDLREKPYLKDLLDKEQAEALPLVFKKLDGAEALIGKRPGVPGADAKEEDWDKYLAQLRPGKADDYEIPAEEGVKRDETFMKTLRESFLKGDISKRQAQKFLGDFMPKLKEYTLAQNKAQADAQAKADADFETLVKASLGEKNKAIMARVRKEITENAPKTLTPYIDKLDNNALAIMAGVIDSILKRYAPEDDLNPQGGAAGDAAKTAREQARALNETISKMDPMDPKVDALRVQLKALYKQAASGGA